jgi:hypothetical protein
VTVIAPPVPGRRLFMPSNEEQRKQYSDQAKALLQELQEKARSVLLLAALVVARK